MTFLLKEGVSEKRINSEGSDKKDRAILPKT